MEKTGGVDGSDRWSVGIFGILGYSRRDLGPQNGNKRRGRIEDRRVVSGRQEEGRKKEVGKGKEGGRRKQKNPSSMPKQQRNRVYVPQELKKLLGKKRSHNNQTHRKKNEEKRLERKCECGRSANAIYSLPSTPPNSSNNPTLPPTFLSFYASPLLLDAPPPKMFYIA